MATDETNEKKPGSKWRRRRVIAWIAIAVFFHVISAISYINAVMTTRASQRPWRP